MVIKRTGSPVLRNFKIMKLKLAATKPSHSASLLAPRAVAKLLNGSIQKDHDSKWSPDNPITNQDNYHWDSLGTSTQHAISQAPTPSLTRKNIVQCLSGEYNVSN